MIKVKKSEQVFRSVFLELSEKAKKEGDFGKLKSLTEKVGKRMHLKTLKMFIKKSSEARKYVAWYDQITYLKDNWPSKAYESIFLESSSTLFKKDNYLGYVDYLEYLKYEGLENLFKKEKKRFISLLKKSDLYSIESFLNLGIGTRRINEIFEERLRRGLEVEERHVSKNLSYKLKDKYVKNIISNGYIFRYDTDGKGNCKSMDIIESLGLRFGDYSDLMIKVIMTAYDIQQKKKNEPYIEFDKYIFNMVYLSGVLLNIFIRGLGDKSIMRLLRCRNIRKIDMRTTMYLYFIEVDNQRLYSWWIRELKCDHLDSIIQDIDYISEKHKWSGDVKKKMIEDAVSVIAKIQATQLFLRKSLSRKDFIVAWREQMSRKKEERDYRFLEKWFDKYGRKPFKGFYTGLLRILLDEGFDIEYTESVIDKRGVKLSEEERGKYINLIYNSV